MVDEKVLLKIRELLSLRDGIDRQLAAIIGGGEAKRGRPRKDGSEDSGINPDANGDPGR